MFIARLSHRRAACHASDVRWAHSTRWAHSASRPPRLSPHERIAARKILVQRHSAETAAQEDQKNMSLVEQLFPEQVKRSILENASTRQVPILPLDLNPTPTTRSTSSPRPRSPASPPSKTALTREKMLAYTDDEAGVLVLRNASNALTTDDFHRLIPRGRHIDGWPSQQYEPPLVVPMRDPTTLEPKNVYFLLFSSRVRAHDYQALAQRVHRLVCAHAPTSVLSPIPPPPNLLINGLNAHDALLAFTLHPPTPGMQLRQLRAPYTPNVRAILECRGWPQLVRRRGKMPFEVRLTLEGRQLPVGSVRQWMLATGVDRGRPWSGGEDPHVVFVEAWEPPRSQRAEKAAARAGTEEGEAGVGTGKKPFRAPRSVFIVGFYTEEAAHTFVHTWHRRPMEVARGDGRAGAEIASTINAEMLW